MIGKMYRPLKISKKRRGYELSHKYMSNLVGREKGGVKKFTQLISLKASKGTNDVTEEVIRIEFDDLTIPVLVDKNKFDKSTAKEAVGKNARYIINGEKKKGTLGRKMERPGLTIDLEGKDEHPFTDFRDSEWIFFKSEEENEDFIGNTEKGKWVLKPEMSSKGGKLTFEIPIYPAKAQQEGADWLRVEISPVVINGEEYMKIDTDAITQVVIVSNTEIHYQ